MSSGIGNRRLMKALGRVLGIEDVIQAPPRMRVDELVPVVAVDPGMAGGGQVQLQAQVSLDGLSSWGWQAVGFPDSLTTPTFPPAALFPNNGDVETVVLGLNLEVQYSAPPAAPPAAGTVMRLQELRQAEGNSVSMIECSTFDVAQFTDGIRWQFFWSYPMWMSNTFFGSDPDIAPINNAPIMAASPIYIPAGSKWGLRMQLWDADMAALAAWPAGTVLNAKAFLSTGARGMRPPGM